MQEATVEIMSTLHIEKSSTSNGFLYQAQLINGDHRAHIKNSQFSTNLYGRFYKNSSLQAHKCRIHQYQQIKQQKQKLESAFLHQEHEIERLERQLKLRRQAKRDAVIAYMLFHKGVIGLQCSIRQYLAKRILDEKRQSRKEHQRQEISKHKIAIFFQCLYHGMKSRQKIMAIKRRIEKQRQIELNSCILIQSMQRKRMAECQYHQKFLELQHLRQNTAALKIQFHTRGLINHRRNMKRHQLIKEKANILIQSILRGFTQWYLQSKLCINDKEQITSNKKDPIKYPSFSSLPMGPRKPFVVGKPRETKSFHCTPPLNPSLMEKKNSRNCSGDGDQNEIQSMKGQSLATRSSEPLKSIILTTNTEYKLISDSAHSQTNQILTKPHLNEQKSYLIQKRSQMGASNSPGARSKCIAYKTEDDLIPSTFQLSFEEDFIENENDLDS